MVADAKLKVPLRELKDFVKKNIPNPLFVVLSGSHAYGFPSIDSDFDLRGAYIAKTREVLGLHKPPENLERKEGPIELVVYELEKFIRLLLSPSGYLIEQINSPYLIIETQLFRQLKILSKSVICKALHNHYSGFAMSVYKKARQANWADVKEDLYLLRILMTGITMLETGKVVVNLAELNKKFKLGVVPELISLKMQSETAKGILNLDKESAELFARLDEAYKSSNLPERIENVDKFNDFLLKVRMANLK
ncbi:MAG: nucleotidyltransferase domain-containing protein [Candidatus Aenigmatarchaeota archaeon]